MDLVDSYLAAVDAQLPPAQRADVIAELRDTLLSRLEAMEAELGRAASKDETAAMLKAFGHPLVVAGRYREHQHLIGPSVYPFYVVTLQWTLGAVFFLQIVLTALNASYTRAPFGELARAASHIAPGLVGAFATVTLVFVVLERAGAGPHLERSWSPRNLKDSPSARPRRIWETLFEMAFEAVFLLLWTGVIRLPPASTGEPRAAWIEAAPIWSVLHTPILVVVAASLAVNALSLLRPARLWTIAACRGAVATASIAIIGVLIGAPALLTPGPAGGDLAQRIADGLNASGKVALAVAAAIWAFEAVKEVWRARRSAVP